MPGFHTQDVRRVRLRASGVRNPADEPGVGAVVSAISRGVRRIGGPRLFLRGAHVHGVAFRLTSFARSKGDAQCLSPSLAQSVIRLRKYPTRRLARGENVAHAVLPFAFHRRPSKFAAHAALIFRADSERRTTTEIISAMIAGPSGRIQNFNPTSPTISSIVRSAGVHSPQTTWT